MSSATVDGATSRPQRPPPPASSGTPPQPPPAPAGITDDHRDRFDQLLLNARLARTRGDTPALEHARAARCDFLAELDQDTAQLARAEHHADTRPRPAPGAPRAAARGTRPPRPAARRHDESLRRDQSTGRRLEAADDRAERHELFQRQLADSRRHGQYYDHALHAT